METHRLQGDKLRLYRRSEGGPWHCATWWNGREQRKSTRKTDLDEAKQIATAWYLELTGKGRAASSPDRAGRGSPVGTHKILNGKVQLFRRAEDGPWHCSASFGKGRQKRKSTKETSLALAREVAEDWYLEMKGMARSGQLEKEKTFADAAEKFAEEYEATTQGHRSPKWVQGHKDRIRLHLMPYFGKKPLSEISAGVAQDYRAWRMTQPEDWAANNTDENGEVKEWNPPARNFVMIKYAKTLKNRRVKLGVWS